MILLGGLHYVFQDSEQGDVFKLTTLTPFSAVCVQFEMKVQADVRDALPGISISHLADALIQSDLQ